MSTAADQTAGAKISIHATAVVIGEAGILIRGPSGTGKSSVGRHLIFLAAHQSHFASLVGDDRILLDNCGGRLVARGHHLIRGLLEQRGLGLLEMRHEPAAVARLVVDIVPPRQAIRFPESEDKYVEFCAVRLPVLALVAGAAASDCAISVLSYLERTEMV
jgi:HPr kinase/phosphorylase